MAAMDDIDYKERILVRCPADNFQENSHYSNY
jgi:hypothetical protein